MFVYCRGAGPGCNSQEVGEKLSDLKNELRQLEEHEQMLDLHTQWVKQSIKNVECDSHNRRYAYIKYEDLKDIFKDEFILAVQAPTDTQLNVPKIEKVIFIPSSLLLNKTAFPVFTFSFVHFTL
jgi:transcription factor E2F4/5